MIRKLLYFFRSIFLNFSRKRSSNPVSPFDRNFQVFLLDEIVGLKTVLNRKIQYSFILLFSFFVTSVSGQITQRGTSTTGNAGGSTLTISKPNGIVAGDVMIVNIAQRGSGTLVNPTSAGWTLIDGKDLVRNGSTYRWGAVLYKVATATDALAGTTSYTFTLNNRANGSVGSIVAFSGVDVSGATPFDVANGAISVQGSQAAVAANTKIIATANAAVIMFGQAVGSAPTWSGWSTISPGTLTEIYDDRNTSYATVGAAWAIKTTTGSTGTVSGTLNSSERNGGILVVLKPLTFLSQIISIDAGSTTWCPGELRNVDVKIKNIGTATWTDGTSGRPNIRVGVKWNDDGTNYADYYSRVSAGNLAPGATQTYTLPIQASNNTGSGYYSNLAAGSNNLIFDVVYEAVSWFDWNSGGVGPENMKSTSAVQTILAAPANKTIAAANSSICSGSNTNITVALSELGVNYQLRDASNALIGSAVAGTNGMINLPTGNLTGTTTFNVLASSCGNSVQMPGTATVTVSQPPTVSNAGPDQTGSASFFTLAANNPTVGTGVWSIVSGPNTDTAQFSSTINPGAIFNRTTAGTYILRWTTSNGVCSSTDDVVIANCVSNLIVNGDFSGSAAAWSPATSVPGSVVEINQETTYFSTGNSDATAELDGAASLRQSVTVVPGVSYTLSFLYARRPGAPDPVAVDVKIIGGSNPASAYFSTSSVTTPQTGSFTFTPTNSPIAIEFYNSLAGSATYGTIIDNIVLLPTTQVSPIATTIPKGTYKTLTACLGSSVLLDVDNISATGVTYSWTTTSSGVSFTSATNIKSPTVTLSGTGLKELKVIATTAGGCASSSSSTFINVIALPTVFNVTGVGSYCVGGSGVSVGLNASTSGISYQLQKDGVNVGTAVTGPTSGAAISFGSQTAAGTYTVVAKNTTTSCTSNMNGVVTINPKPVILDMTSTTCSGSSFTVTPVNGGSVIVPANTTYSWGLPSGTGFTGGAISSGTPLDITGNLVNTTNVNQTAVYTVTPTSSGCPGTPFKITVTINPTNTAGTASSTPTLCINVPLTNSTYVTHTTTGATGIGSPSNLPTGLSATWATNKITISGTPTVAGTFAYTIPLVGGCGTVNATGSIIISPATVGGTAASTSCYTTSSNTATITLSGQTGNVIKWESSTDNFVSTPVAITNTTTTLSGINVTTTTYYRAVVQSGNCSTGNSSVVKLVAGIAPTANNATLPTCNGFTANWAKVNGATSYLLSVSDDNFASTLSGYTNVDVGDNSSFSVTGLLPNKTYQYVLKSVFSCGNYAVQSNVIAITTADLPIAGAFTGGAPVICVGSSTTFSNSTPGGVWSVTNGSGAANITTSGDVTGSTVGDVTVVYTVKNGSCSNSISRALTINPLLVKPMVGETIGVGCSNLGSVTLSNLPTGNWTLYQTGTALNSFTNTTLSETSYTVTGLAVGTYYFAVNNGTCTSAQTTAVDITDQTSTSWNGTKWSNDPPTRTKNAIIESVNPNQPFATDAFACSLIINTGVVVTVPTGITLTITNAITTNGQLIFENNSSLLQTNNVANTGDITYKRTALQIRQADFVYWSSPVKAQQLLKVSPDTKPDMFYYHHGSGWIDADRNADMIVGKGYIIRGPENYSNTGKADYTASFIGVPNNGDIVGEPLTPGKYRLIGNPYPSALSIDRLIQGNTVLNGTVYFWTHNTAVTPVGNYDYNPNDYASYNLSGSVRTSKAALTGNEKPSGYVGAGQAFFVSGRLAGPVLYNNLMRFGGTDNSQFFKSSETSKEASIEKNRIWLNMTNSKGSFKQLLIGYIEGATNAYENKFDGVSFDGNPYLDFYSMVNTTKLVIQGRALPFTDADVVPLGYKTSLEDTFTIAIDEVDGKMNNQAIYLEDKKTGIIHDLRTSDYTFTSAIGTFADRFVLKYANKTLGTGDFENIEDGILISVKNKIINVLSSKENIKDVTIFDITGKTLYSKNKVSNTELQIQNLPSSNQVLLVKVTLDNDFTTTRKIIFQ